MASIDPDGEFPHTILVATDGSDVARGALEHSLDIARQCNGEIHLLTVVDTTATPVAFGVEDVHDLERAKKRLVEDLAVTYDDHAVDVTSAVRRGRPARAILAYADETEADLIALGKKGRDGVAQVLLGSTTERVVHEASVPVLVVPEDTDSESATDT